MLENKEDCFIAVAYFTDEDIARKIIERTENGYKTMMILNLADLVRPESATDSIVKVSKALLDIFESFGRQAFTDEGNLQIKTLGVNLSKTSQYTVFHHKFILNKNRCGFGSLNFTNNAFQNNYENFIFTEEQGVVLSFLKEFSALWSEANSFLTQNGKIRSISCPSCGGSEGIDFESYGPFCSFCGYRIKNTGF